MIVYRDARERARPRCRLERLVARAERWRGGLPPHDEVVAGLIEFGEVEAGVLDALFPAADAIHPLGKALRQVGRLLGHALWHSWRRDHDRFALWAAALRCELRDLLDHPLPDEIDISVPEGYAYYGLHPEAYLEAARDFAADCHPSSVAVIGLRGIGTGLSSAVEAAARELGCDAVSYALRPHGHPFDRHPNLGAGLSRALAARPDRWYLIVDEGPGISGSSIAGTAGVLVELGIPEGRIVFFPSWQTDGTHLRSDLARERWPRHRQYVVPFSRVRATAGSFGRKSDVRCLDLSAGQWRELLYDDPAEYPAVQPQHERRKFLARAGQGPSVLRKFVGLGHHGEHALARARLLYDAGFSPEPIELSDGYLARRWVEGSPLAPGQTCESPRGLLERIARYLAFLRSNCPHDRTAPLAQLQEMLRTNVRQGLGDDWAERLERLPGFDSPAADDPVAIDGRMFPHEWIRTASGWIKTDALQHHADHFLPGSQDIAWDLAGCAVEFRLDAERRRVLLHLYADESGDEPSPGRLAFHTLAYLGFRLGYATVAADSLEGSDDGARFGAEVERYRSLLEREISEPAGAIWR